MIFSPYALVGQSERFLSSTQTLPELSQIDSPALITGEAGSGKVTCARIIHYLSKRAYKPFIRVSCETMLHSRFEANGGVLFLDNVDALGPDAQAQLMDILDVDVPIICAARPDISNRVDA